MIVAIDFGITNTDIAVSNGGALDFFSFKTNYRMSTKCSFYSKSFHNKY